MGAESRHSSEGILVIREHNRRVCHKKQDKVLKLLSRPPEQNSRKCSFNSSDCLVKKCLYSFTIFPLFHKASQLSSFSPFAQGESADWTQDQMNISSMALPVALLRSSAFLGCRSCDGGLQSRPPVQNRRWGCTSTMLPLNKMAGLQGWPDTGTWPSAQTNAHFKKHFQLLLYCQMLLNINRSAFSAYRKD